MSSTRTGPTTRQIESQLKEHGFCQYHASHPTSHVHASSRWLIKILDEHDKIKYFVSAYLYPRIRDHLPDNVEFEAILYPNGGNGPWLTVSIHGENSVTQALAYYAELYSKMGICLDPYN